MRRVDYPNDQARPAAPVRSGIPEHGRIPKYYAVKARISLLIQELGEGGLLPTERDLAVTCEVSRETVRQALRELLLEGRLRRRGRGTVVAGPKLEQPLSLAGSFNGGTPTVVKSCTADVVCQPQPQPQPQPQSQSLSVAVPAGASSVGFRFRYTGANNWYWAIDGVKVTAS